MELAQFQQEDMVEHFWWRNPDDDELLTTEFLTEGVVVGHGRIVFVEEALV